VRSLKLSGTLEKDAPEGKLSSLLSKMTKPDKARHPTNMPSNLGGES
jgi:hypothetical protein